jgi:hypothetical protein
MPVKTTLTGKTHMIRALSHDMVYVTYLTYTMIS